MIQTSVEEKTVVVDDVALAAMRDALARDKPP